MSNQRVWTKDDILEMWPQAVDELRGFQHHIEGNTSLTASQLGMALQLANREFQRLKDDTIKKESITKIPDTNTEPNDEGVNDIIFPDNIRRMADEFLTKRVAKQTLERLQKRTEAIARKVIEEGRLESGLVYAQRIFNWAKAFRESDMGQELMETSHVPTAYKNIFFFDGQIERTPWLGFGVSPKGLFLSRDNRFETLTRKYIESAEDLAKSVAAKVLKTVCEWIDNGLVWECIERRFAYLYDVDSRE